MPIPEVLPIRDMDDLHTAFVGHRGGGTQCFLNEFWVYRFSDRKPLSELPQHSTVCSDCPCCLPAKRQSATSYGLKRDSIG
jgi:hypothetical protein